MTQRGWLDAEEMEAWRNFIELSHEIMPAMDADLVGHGINIGDYEVLVLLSEANERRMRMVDLAAKLALTPSGLTRRLDGMVKAGLVHREPSTQDRRVSLAVVTDEGIQVLEAAAPDHVEGVRRHFLDHLTRVQIGHLGAALSRIRKGREAAASPVP